MNKVKVRRCGKLLRLFGVVISRKTFDKISDFIDYSKESGGADIIADGTDGDSEGYFVQPTVIVMTDPKFKTMKRIFSAGSYDLRLWK